MKRVTDRLTMNAGLRYDLITGCQFDRFRGGAASAVSLLLVSGHLGSQQDDQDEQDKQDEFVILLSIQSR